MKGKQGALYKVAGEAEPKRTASSPLEPPLERITALNVVIGARSLVESLEVKGTASRCKT